MIQILTDAEYERLTPIERAQYWNARFNDIQEERDRLLERNIHLRQVLDQIKDTLRTA